MCSYEEGKRRRGGCQLGTLLFPRVPTRERRFEAMFRRAPSVAWAPSGHPRKRRVPTRKRRSEATFQRETDSGVGTLENGGCPLRTGFQGVVSRFGHPGHPPKRPNHWRKTTPPPPTPPPPNLSSLLPTIWILREVEYRREGVKKSPRTAFPVWAPSEKKGAQRVPTARGCPLRNAVGQHLLSVGTLWAPSTCQGCPRVPRPHIRSYTRRVLKAIFRLFP